MLYSPLLACMPIVIVAACDNMGNPVPTIDIAGDAVSIHGRVWTHAVSVGLAGNGTRTVSSNPAVPR